MKNGINENKALSQTSVMQSVLISENDFRVGNLFYGNYETEEDEKIHSVICKILGYDPFDSHFWVENKEGIEEFCSFQKIPITEEWILKLGFIKDEILEFYRNDKSNSTIIIDYDFICLLGYSHVKIKYVHQLQNLYYALTQRELTVA
jgi:hypothetical protein